MLLRCTCIQVPIKIFSLAEPLPLSMSQPALLRSRSAFEDDAIPENEVVRNKMEFQRSSSLGDLCERVEPLQQRLQGRSNHYLLL